MSLGSQAPDEGGSSARKRHPIDRRMKFPGIALENNIQLGVPERHGEVSLEMPACFPISQLPFVTLGIQTAHLEITGKRTV